MPGSKEKVVRLVTLAPELQGAMEFIETLTGKGIVQHRPHPLSAQQVHEAADHGQPRHPHLQRPNPCPPGRVPGAALVDDRIACELICDGIHLHPISCG